MVEKSGFAVTGVGVGGLDLGFRFRVWGLGTLGFKV